LKIVVRISRMQDKDVSAADFPASRRYYLHPLIPNNTWHNYIKV